MNVYEVYCMYMYLRIMTCAPPPPFWGSMTDADLPRCLPQLSDRLFSHFLIVLLSSTVPHSQALPLRHCRSSGFSLSRLFVVFSMYVRE
jgi:hypothetical protein